VEALKLLFMIIWTCQKVHHIHKWALCLGAGTFLL